MKRIIFATVALCLLLAAMPASAVSPERSHTRLTGLTIDPRGSQTNSLIIYNNSGTAQVTITKAGVVTWAGAQTFSAGVTFDSTTIWGAAGTIDFDGTTIDLDPTSTFDLEMAAAKTASIDVSDNLTSAFSIMEAAVPYIVVNTNTGTESIVFGGTGDDPDFFMAGTGELDIAGTLDVEGAADIKGMLTLSKGSATALSVSAGGELTNAGTLNQDGNADFAGNVVLSGTSKTVSAASLIDANAGLTADGAAITLNHDSNFTTGIGTASNTQAVTIGGGSNTVAVASSSWDVSTLGAFSGVTTIAASDTVSLSKNSGDALTLTGASGSLNNDGLLDQNGNADLAGNVVLSGASKTVSAASLVDMNAGMSTTGPVYTDGVTTDTTTASTAATDHVMLINTASAAFTLTLSTADCDAAADVGRTLIIKCIGSCGAKPLTIDTQASETIDGAASATINTNYGAINLVCGAADTWYIY